VRVLITGGAGFIGSHLCERFLENDYDVIAVDNLITGNEKNIEHLLSNPNFSFIKHDITEPLEIDVDLDIILNFASPASPIDYLQLPFETLKVGSYGTHNMLELARVKQAKFLQASTSEVYGDPLIHPQTETYSGNVDPIGPRSVYDEAKRYAEAVTMAYHHYHGLDTRIVRIFNTYGPRMRLNDGRVVPNFIAQAIRKEPLTIYGDGQQTRSFQYVDDLVDGIWLLLHADCHEPINIGNPNEMTILDFAKKINTLVDNASGIVYRDERIQGDPQVRCPDITRAKALLDWEPRVDLAVGLDNTIRYFRDVVV
jgi:dTDP-glucose 4,6-dehydratase